MRYVQLIVAATEYTEWQRPLFDLYHYGKNSPGWWGWPPTPFGYIYHHVQNCCVRSSWEGRYCIIPLFLLYLYIYSVVAAAYIDHKQESTLSTRLELSGLLRWWPGVLNPVKQRSDWLLKKNSLFLDYERWLLYEDPQNRILVYRHSRIYKNVQCRHLTFFLYRICPERLTANNKVATVLASIPASSDTVDSEGRKIKHCWMKQTEIN